MSAASLLSLLSAARETMAAIDRPERPQASRNLVLLRWPFAIHGTEQQ
ncbi:hypothetical protein [Bradyrhizobium sp. CCBAU 45384]|nr:hypothetical protein [Bradyrhizobium sp. CCBAU 45384]